MKIRNRQRNVPYIMPIKKDLTRFYYSVKNKINFYSWSIRSGHKEITDVAKVCCTR